MTIATSLLIFLLKVIIIVIALLIIVAGVAAIKSKGKQEKGKITIKNLNEQFSETAEEIQDEVLTKNERKQLKKQNKKQGKTKKEKRIYVIDFDGDIKASAVEALRREVTAILTTATKEDEVLVRLTSPGGVVHGYGLAASQLDRIKDRGIHLTVAVDTVAASGGYMMACVADTILAAPFAIIGSIGAVMQIPNFHRFLKKHNIDFEQLTAGEFKRTLSLFGENTAKGRQKTQEDLEDVHLLFKDFIRQHRPQVDLEKVATGEHWFGTRAINLNLVDKLITSDDYLFSEKENASIFSIHYATKKSMSDKFFSKAQQLLSHSV